jgi:hypothetical protein
MGIQDGHADEKCARLERSAKPGVGFAAMLIKRDSSCVGTVLA